MGFPVIQTKNMNWGDLDVTIYFGEEITEEIGDDISKLIYSWYTVGSYQAFEGPLHSMSNVWIEESKAGHGSIHE